MSASDVQSSVLIVNVAGGHLRFMPRPKGSRIMLIDMHAHVVPEFFPPGTGRPSATLWPFLDHFEEGRARVMINGENFRTIHDGNWNYERRLADMATSGVDAEVLSPMPELLSYWMDPNDALDISRHTNQFIAELCSRAPNQFFGLGMIPLQAPELAAKELSGIREMGLLGIELGSNVNGDSLGIPAHLPFFQEAERLGLAIFAHALHPTVNERLASPSQVNPIGFPTDTGLTIASIMGGGVAEGCPELRIAFSHGGGTFPFMLPRYSHAWSRTWNEEPQENHETIVSEVQKELPHPPAYYARRFYYDTLLFDRRAIHYQIEMLGHRQLLIGTDYPYMEREAPVGKTIKTLGLSDEVVEDISWRNCFRFLDVRPPSGAS